MTLISIFGSDALLTKSVDSSFRCTAHRSFLSQNAYNTAAFAPCFHGYQYRVYMDVNTECKGIHLIPEISFSAPLKMQ